MPTTRCPRSDIQVARYPRSEIPSERDTHDPISTIRIQPALKVHQSAALLPGHHGDHEACFSIRDHAPAIVEIMRFIASVSGDTPAGITPAGIVMAGTAATVIATAGFSQVVIAAGVAVQAGIAWVGIDCSPCTDCLPCIDYLVFADYSLRGDYSLNSHCLVRSNFGVNASLGVSTGLGVSAGFGAYADYPVCADFPLPDVFGIRACLPLRRSCPDRPALVNARTITR